MIEFEEVTFSYPGAKQPAIRELSLQIGRGERVCILGANGSGKSTFARLMAGLVKPSDGSVRLEGKSPAEADVGFLFQNVDNQIVAATVDRDIAFGLENWGIERETMVKQVGEIMAEFKIGSLASHLTAELSGGEKQRVALAAIMVLSPGVLILDEPDSFLDVDGRQILKRALKEIRGKSGDLAEIRITQYPHLAREYDRVMIFDRGSVVADGAAEDVLLDENLLRRTSLTTVDVDIAEQNGWDFSRREAESQSVSLQSIAFDRVSFAYDKLPVVRQLSFQMGRGESVGLVGASGTGKSTVLQLLCGLLAPDSGQIIAMDADRDVVGMTRFPTAVTASLQQPERQFFLPTCAEEIAFGPSNMGVKLRQHEIGALLELVGLPVAMMKRDPYTLSGGEQRRLAFAAVLALRPSFIVFDEPACGLDRDGVSRFMALSRRLRESGVGQLIISHDGEIIRTLTDRLLLLDRGGEYKELETAAFFASEEAAKVVNLPYNLRPNR